MPLMTPISSPTESAGHSRKLLGNPVTPEWEMLLAAASPADATATMSRLIGHPFDWVLFERLAETHGLLPMAASKLGVLPGIPNAMTAELHKICQENARRSLWFAGELFSIIETLSAAGVLAIPYKGPTLAATAQGDLVLRQFHDLDILILRKDWARSKKALIDAGFSPKLDLTAREEKAYLESACDFTFHHPPVKNVLEIHWDLVPNFYSVQIPLDHLAARAKAVELCGRAIPSLAPEDLLLCLMVHGAKHAWSRLCWLSDIAYLIQRVEIDWKTVRRRAERWRIARITRIGLFLTRWMLGAEIPQAVEAWMQQDAETAVLAETLSHNMFHDCKILTESLAYFWLFARQREDVRDRVRLFARLATTSTLSEWRSVRLPEPLFPLYGAVRAWRLGQRFVRGGM